MKYQNSNIALNEKLLGLSLSLIATLGLSISLNATPGLTLSLIETLGLTLSLNATLGLNLSLNVTLGLNLSLNATLGLNLSLNATLGLRISLNATLGLYLTNSGIKLNYNFSSYSYAKKICNKYSDCGGITAIKYGRRWRYQPRAGRRLLYIKNRRYWSRVKQRCW